MRIPLAVSAWAFLVLIGAAVVGAADRRRGPTTRPTSEPTPSATLVDFTGLLQIRPSVYDPWQIPARGAQIPFTGELRIGPRTAVELKFEGTDRMIVLDRLGTSRISTMWEWSKDHPLPATGNVRY